MEMAVLIPLETVPIHLKYSQWQMLRSIMFSCSHFRDDPQEMPVFVAANSAKKGCKIEPEGDNLFTAVRLFLCFLHFSIF